MSIALVLLVLALICFVLACIPIPVRINLMALGLAFWVLSLLLGGMTTGHGLTLR